MNKKAVHPVVDKNNQIVEYQVIEDCGTYGLVWCRGSKSKCDKWMTKHK